MFAAACETGAYVGGASKTQVEALHNFGDALGICFQIIDDFLDYRGKKASLGKNTGNDFKERKVTLPLIIAYSQASKEEKEFWERTIEKGEQEPEDFKKALNILNDKGVLDATYNIALDWSNIAKRNLRKKLIKGLR